MAHVNITSLCRSGPCLCSVHLLTFTLQCHATCAQHCRSNGLILHSCFSDDSCSFFGIFLYMNLLLIGQLPCLSFLRPPHVMLGMLLGDIQFRFGSKGDNKSEWLVSCMRLFSFIYPPLLTKQSAYLHLAQITLIQETCTPVSNHTDTQAYFIFHKHIFQHILFHLWMICLCCSLVPFYKGGECTGCSLQPFIFIWWSILAACLLTQSMLYYISHLGSRCSQRWLTFLSWDHSF